MKLKFKPVLLPVQLCIMKLVLVTFVPAEFRPDAVSSADEISLSFIQGNFQGRKKLCSWWHISRVPSGFVKTENLETENLETVVCSFVSLILSIEQLIMQTCKSSLASFELLEFTLSRIETVSEQTQSTCSKLAAEQKQHRLVMTGATQGSVSGHAHGARIGHQRVSEEFK